MTSESLTLSAPAKINLFLRVLHRRADGFHELETIFQEIDLADRLTLTFRPQGIELNCDQPELPVDDGNLVVRAAQALQRLCGIRAGCALNLEKCIPLSAGLGGGSSDAAVALLGLNHLWNLHLSPETLSTLAAALGSDVPFFLSGGTAYATGRGESLVPLNADPAYVGLLVYPKLRISTAWAYQAGRFSLTKSKNYFNLNFISNSLNDPSSWQDRFDNDLEAVVFRHHPLMAEILAEFKRAGAFYARMSGSGSTLFGLFDSEESARSAENRFDPYDRWVFRPVYRRHRSLS
ncbi:4-(cytidine 5'-diphospho)-2-C-methyl-D-erythritol kinase [candidate division KSB1 bacterium]|nr:4-(cytidine 5'-diphospho)-2-C-methyl-D-erythritol kinase [candidate division KSB1 bacterium]